MLIGIFMMKTILNEFMKNWYGKNVLTKKHGQQI